MDGQDGQASYSKFQIMLKTVFFSLFLRVLTVSYTGFQ